jgi:hypothetical protein
MNFKDFPFVKSIMLFIFKPYPTPLQKEKEKDLLFVCLLFKSPAPTLLRKRRTRFAI